MKKIIMAILLSFLMMITVCAAETADGTVYTPSIFLGFDDGVMPAGLTRNSVITLLDGETEYIKNGIYQAKTTTGDPYFTYETDFIYGDYSEIRLRMKFKTTDENATKCNFQVFFKGKLSDGTAYGFHGNYSVLESIGLDSGNDFCVYTLPLDSLSILDGATVTSIRIDMISTVAEMYIDYITLVPANPNKDLVYNFDTSMSPWAANAQFIGTSVANGILTGTTTAHNGVISYSGFNYLGADYPHIYVRMMIDKEVAEGAEGDEAVPGIVSGSRDALMYTNLKNSENVEIKGWSAAYEGYSYASNKIYATDNQKYKVYDFDFTNYTPYLNNYITHVVFNPVNLKDLRVNIDTILFKNPNSLSWEFECDGLYEGWDPKNYTYSISDGKLKYTEADSTYDDPKIVLSGLDITADNYIGLEVIMKHNLTGTDKSTTMHVYYSGVDSNGNSFTVNSTDMTQINVSDSTSGENYRYYFIDLSKASRWAGSTIKSLRVDMLNALGNCEVESMRLIPYKTETALDPSLMSLNYDFLNEERGSADGTISIDFGEQSRFSARRINLCWASGNDTDGYTQLSDYSVLFSEKGSFFATDIVLNKNLLIPEAATALVAKVTDSEKTFDLVFKLPAEKIPEPYGTPLYTGYFASDFHLGGWGSNPNPNVRQAAARTEILASDAEFLVVIGDITQWYGEIEYESQWEFATNYFKEFDIPVYMVKGNHDEPNYPSGYVMGKGYECFSYHYFDDFLDNWMAYSSEQGYYDVERPGETLDYYDTEINGQHYIFLAVPDTGHYAFGDAQLKWLDMKLYEKEQSGKPIFVFGHVPANGKVNYQIALNDGSIKDFDKLEPILNRHPTAIYSSGDSHYTLDSILPNTVDGKQVLPSYINDGAVIEAYKAADETVVNSPRSAVAGHNSHGLYVEVYEDKMITRARDFMNGRYLSLGLSKVTFKDECPIEEFSVSGETKDNTVVLSIDEPVDGLTYTWYVDGEQNGVTGNSITVIDTFAGFVAVRASDTNGNYRSVVFETLSEVPGVELTESPKTKFTGIAVDRFAANNNITVNFDASSALAGYKLVISLYDIDDRLIDARIVTLSEAEALAGSYTSTFNISGTDYVKTTVFSDVGTLIPVCTPYIQKK